MDLENISATPVAFLTILVCVIVGCAIGWFSGKDEATKPPILDDPKILAREVGKELAEYDLDCARKGKSAERSVEEVFEKEQNRKSSWRSYQGGYEHSSTLRALTLADFTEEHWDVLTSSYETTFQRKAEIDDMSTRWDREMAEFREGRRKARAEAKAAADQVRDGGPTALEQWRAKFQELEANSR